MRVRSDIWLKLLLLDLHERALSPVVADQLMDVVKHVGGGGSPYRAGQELLRLLKFAAREASGSGDPDTAQGLKDAHAYATGCVLEARTRREVEGAPEFLGVLQGQPGLKLFQCFNDRIRGAVGSSGLDHAIAVGGEDRAG